jgi:hypothetical protein
MYVGRSHTTYISALSATFYICTCKKQKAITIGNIRALLQQKWAKIDECAVDGFASFCKVFSVSKQCKNNILESFNKIDGLKFQVKIN